MQTTGTTAPLVTGWAELTVTGAIGGTAIFALQTPGQPDSEAAIPFAEAASTHLYIPYDNTPGYSTGIAFTNPNQNQAATVTVLLSDEAGNLAAGRIVTVPTHGHVSKMLSDLFTGIGGTRGTVSLISDVPIFGLGIRADGTTFTSLKVVVK